MAAFQWLLAILTSFAHASTFNGMIYVDWSSGGYSSSASDQSLADIVDSRANWVSIVWTWYQDNISSTTIAPTSYSPTTADVQHAIDTAHSNGFQVAIKPHVDLSNDPSHWRGQIGTGFTSSQWSTWFQSYESFINATADLAAAAGVKLFVVGTELIETETQVDSWRHVISSVRSRYGSNHIDMVYGPNWSPGPANVQWWDALDYMGVDAYYPLATSATPSPTVDQLAKAWNVSVPASGTTSIFTDLQKVAQQWNKRLIFTEVGYQSQQGCAVSPYGTTLGVWDSQCQNSAYGAVFNVFGTQSWFAGTFWWAWSTNPSEGGRCDLGYSPHNKDAETTLQANYGSLSADQTPAPARRPRPFTLRNPQEMVRRVREAMKVPAPTPITVYDCKTGSLASGWDNYSWSGTVNFKGTDKVAPSCSYSIDAQMDAWGCVSLHVTSLDISTYTYVNVTLSAASNSESTITIYVDDQNGNELAQTPLSKYTPDCAFPTDSFVTATVPLADINFGVTVISRLNFKNGQANSGQWWHGSIVLY